MAHKPSTPKGTRDFNPTEVNRRNHIMSIIKSQFQKFGFQPIETPSFENSETLLGKYGEEGDRLVFRILNSGDYLKKADNKLLLSKDSSALASIISDRALRYDLTVPFARYVVQHQNEIDFPFKRYQIQPVWRADRPQKGRFREFFQCDADVVGSESLWQEVEFVQLYDNIFNDLGLNGTTIKLNNRKILSGIAETIGAEDKLIDFTVSLDKLDKIGEDKVKEEMLKRGISQESIDRLQPLFNLEGSFSNQLAALKSILKTSDVAKEGIDELAFIHNSITKLGLHSSKLSFDVTLARGLEYYTGTIFEVSAPDSVQMGSIGGGGRYDDLTGIFGLKNVSGVGISFGLDRIYLVMEALDLFPRILDESVKVMFVNFGEKEALKSLDTINILRGQGISCELYPDAIKPNKQLKYADKRNIPYVVMVGEAELEENNYTLKNMISGDQERLLLNDLIERLS